MTKRTKKFQKMSGENWKDLWLQPCRAKGRASRKWLRSRKMWTPHPPVRAQTHIFSCAHHSAQFIDSPHFSNVCTPYLFKLKKSVLPISLHSFQSLLSSPHWINRLVDSLRSLQCTTAGPYNAIPSKLLEVGSVCGLGPDLVGIHSISLAARYRVAACSSTLRRGLEKVNEAREHNCAPLFCSISRLGT